MDPGGVTVFVVFYEINNLPIFAIKYYKNKTTNLSRIDVQALYNRICFWFH